MYHDAFLGKLILQGNSLNLTLWPDCKRKRKDSRRGREEGREERRERRGKEREEGGEEERGEGRPGAEKRQRSGSHSSALCLTSVGTGFPNLSDNHPWEDNSKNPDQLEWCDPRLAQAPLECLKKNGQCGKSDWSERSVNHADPVLSSGLTARVPPMMIN